ncbi:MAG TPA: hypothetical protein VF733_02650 [Candidatus Saccharimonadales bacterium]
MPEQQFSNSFQEYEYLVGREAALAEAHPDAVDENIAQAFEQGLAVIRRRINEVKAAPDFVDAMWASLDTNARALLQLRQLEGILPEEQLAAQAVPYERAALSGLRLASGLRLGAEGMERLELLREEIGSLVINREVTATPPAVTQGLTETLTGSPPQKLEETVTAAETIQRAEPAAQPPRPIEPAQPTGESQAPSELSQISIPGFSLREALIFVDFLTVIGPDLRAYQLHVLSASELDELANVLAAQIDASDERAEYTEQNRSDLLKRIIGQLEDDEFLPRLLDIPEDDPRFALVVYAMDVSPEALRNFKVSASQTRVQKRLDQIRPFVPGMPSDPVVIVQEAAVAPSDPDPVAEMVVANPEETVGKELQALFRQRVNELIKHVKDMDLQGEEAYSAQRLAAGLRVPTTRAMKAIAAARQQGQSREGIGVDAPKLTVKHFIKLLLRDEPQFAEMYNHAGLADQTIAKVLRAQASRSGK